MEGSNGGCCAELFDGVAVEGNVGARRSLWIHARRRVSVAREDLLAIGRHGEDGEEEGELIVAEAAGELLMALGEVRESVLGDEAENDVHLVSEDVEKGECVGPCERR